jgi:hypothetical protein
MLNAYSVFNVAQLENLPAICNVEPEKFPDDVKLDEGSFVPQCHAAAFRCKWRAAAPAYLSGTRPGGDAEFPGLQQPGPILYLPLAMSAPSWDTASHINNVELGNTGDTGQMSGTTRA